MKIMIIAVSACLFCSCSFTMSSVPTGYRPCDEPDCSGYAAPAFDTVGALILAGLATPFLVAANGPPPYDPCADGDCGECIMCGTWIDGRGLSGAIGTALLIPAVIYAVASIAGYSRAAKCKQATRAHQDWRELSPEEKKLFEQQWRQIIP